MTSIASTRSVLATQAHVFVQGDQVESVWMSGEKKFCFVTFRSEAEAANGLQLDNIQLMGRPLRIGRPSDYVPTNSGTVAAPLGQMTAVAKTTGAGLSAQPQQAAATVVVRLANSVTNEEVDDTDEYNDILGA